MAANIGPRIGIDGEAEYRKELQNIIQQTKTLDSEMKKLQKGFTDDTSAKKKNKEQAAVLRKEQEALTQQVDKLREMTAKASEKFGENSTEALKWQESLNKAEGQLESVNNQLRDVTGARAFAAEMEAAGGKVTEVGKKIEDVGKSMTKYITGPLTGIGVASVKTFGDFEAEMDKVAAISGATGEDFKALEDKAKYMGETTVFSASESAQALEYMAMAGWKTEDMLDGIEGVMDLAAASGEDLATTSDIVTDALTAFGLTAKDSSHFADILAAASSNANTNVGMMGDTFKYVAPVAGAMGFSAEDTAIAIGLMANSGIKASQAGTALRSIITRLAAPTKESETAMNMLDISITNADGTMKDMGTIMGDLRGAFSGLSEEEQALYAKQIAGQEAMSGFLAIVNATDEDVNKLSGAIYGCDGAAAAMADTMNDNLNGKVTLLKSAMEGAAISVGEALAPQVEFLTGKINDAVTWFNSLDDTQKQNIVRIGEMVAAIGPGIMIIGKLTSGVGTTITTVGKLTSGIAKLTGGFNPWVLAIGAAVAAGVLLYKNWDTIKEKGTEIFSNLTSTVTGAIDRIKSAFNFSWSLPHLAMPHPYISGSFSLNPPRVPSFGIQWYDKAKNAGMLFNKPTIFGAQGNTALGAGETNRELLIGYDNLMDMISTAAGRSGGNTINMTINGAPGQDVRELADIVMERMNYVIKRSEGAWT